MGSGKRRRSLTMQDIDQQHSLELLYTIHFELRRAECTGNFNFAFYQQMGANILLFVCSNLLGAIDFYIADRRQRRSVLETRQSLEVKITLESENRQQVCLALTF